MFLRLKNKSAISRSGQVLSDEQLVEGYLRTANKEFVAELFERYTHLVYGICLKYLQNNDQCKDAVMEIFEGLFHKLTVHKILCFRNWLYTVTRNHCLMILRKAGSYQRVVNGLQTAGDGTVYPEDMSEDEELMYSKAMIISAVEQLNNEQGTCIRLMYIDDKSYHDISAITGYTLNEVKSHIQNGKRNLKNYLLQNGNTKT